MPTQRLRSVATGADEKSHREVAIVVRLWYSIRVGKTRKDTTMEIKNRGFSAVALPFEGTAEQAQENWHTHSFGWDDRCMRCDCRPWGVWANYPCGNADMVKSQSYELPGGERVWVKILVKNGQELFLGVFDSPNHD